jgi:thiol-disulfide isomerase/thioredoxin
MRNISFVMLFGFPITGEKMKCKWLGICLGSVLMISMLFTDGLAQDNLKLNSINFRAKNLDGRRVRLNKLLEEGPVMLNLWALWCVPCMKEMPHINKIYADYKKQGLSVIAVNEDSPTDQSKVKPFIR